MVPGASAASVSSTTQTTIPTPAHPPFSWSSPRFVAAGPGNHLAPPKSPLDPSPAAIQASSCPTTNLCVLPDLNGDIWTSKEPFGSSPTWHRATIPPSRRIDGIYGRSFDGVSCSSDSFCAAFDESGEIFVSKDPTGGASAWVSAFSDPNTLPLGGIACVSTRLCVATDDADGDVVSSRDPGAPHSHWTFSHITGRSEEGLGAIACPSLSFCMALSKQGNAYFTDKPGASRTSWSHVEIDSDSRVGADSGDYGSNLTSLSCPSVSLCLATDEDGNILSTTQPTQTQPWKSTTPSPERNRAVLSCGSVSLCVYVDSWGAFVSYDPTGGAGAWQGSDLPQLFGGFGFGAVSCVAPAFCMLTSPNGDIANWLCCME